MVVRRVLSIVLAGSAACGLLAGCSGDGSSNSAAPRTFLNITGNWGFTATSTTYQGATAPVGVQLTAANGAVTGIAHIFSSCYAITDNVPLTGTEDYDGNLSLTSSSVNGNVLTITAKLASATAVSSGTYSIAANTGCKDSGTINGSTVAPVSGTYKGTVKSLANSATFPVTAALTQSSTADVNGFEHLTGSVSFMGSPCVTTSTINNTATNTEVIGNLYLAMFSSGGSPNVLTYGTLSADAKTLNVTYQLGNCAGDYGSGILTLQ